MQQLVGGELLHFPVGVPDVGVVVLDGGGQVAGEDLRRVVVKGRGGGQTGVGVAAEHVPPDHGQGVGQHRHHVGVLLNVLLKGVAHQPPAVDVPHPGEVGEERVLV